MFDTPQPAPLTTQLLSLHSVMGAEQNYPFADQFLFGPSGKGAIVGGGGSGTQFAPPTSDLGVSG